MIAGRALLPWTVLLLFVASACSNSNSPTPTQVTTQNLHFEVWPGIIVTPTPQKQDGVDGTGLVFSSSQITEGSTLSYRFDAQDGIAQVLVKVDGVSAPTTGTIVMDKSHTVTAGISTRVGAPMPAFAGQDANGATTRTIDLRGKVAFVDFGEMTCPGSISGAPVLRSLYNTYHPRGLEIVTVLVYGPTTKVPSTANDLRTWQQTYSLPFTIVSDPSNATRVFNVNIDSRVTDFPTEYLVDTAGVIRFRSAGWDEAGLRAALATYFP